MNMRPNHSQHDAAVPTGRRGFTLVELMVSMALVIFIMLLMTQAFVAALETFRQLKSLGDMDEKLRSAGTLLKNDIGAYHFEGSRKLSDPTFFENGPPAQGFMRIVQGSAAGSATYPLEGADEDMINVYRAVDHTIHMTVKAPLDNNPKDFFATNINFPPAIPPTTPPAWAQLGSPDSRYQVTGTFTSQWMEVAYFLAQAIPSQSTITDPAQSVTTALPLYTLYRRQRLAVLPVYSSTSSDPANYGSATQPYSAYSGVGGTAYAEISCVQDMSQGTIHFNSPTDLTVPENRFGGNVFSGATPVYTPLPDATTNGWSTDVNGNDILLTDVLSFQIQVYDPTTTDFIDIPALPPATANNTTFSASNTHIFDTWCNGTGFQGSGYSTWATQGAKGLPLGYLVSDPLAFKSIKAIKVTLRIWDRKTTNARQMTFIIGT